MKPSLSALALLGALAACDAAPRSADATPVDSLKLRPGYVVDSMLSMDEMLRRFRTDLGPAPRSLEHGAVSRERLVRDFVRALAERDSGALRRMHVSRAEFGWLYFPGSRFTHPPYELPPEILWLQMTAESGKGITRALRLFEPGGAYIDHACDSAPESHGANRLWTGCTVRWRSTTGAEESFRLFGTVLERGGRFKFLSYANSL